jgi:hypothetical protein
MHKGKLVNPIEAKSHMVPGPYVVLRSPYEIASTHNINGRKITQMTLCVDLLAPSGDVIKGVACSILEYVS